MTADNEEKRFEIACQETAGRVTYWVSVSLDDVPELVAALRRAGRTESGYSIEAFVIRVLEVDDPGWAEDLEFDSEGFFCVVRCQQQEPLRLLVERLQRQLADRASTRRLVNGLPED